MPHQCISSRQRKRFQPTVQKFQENNGFVGIFMLLLKHFWELAESYYIENDNSTAQLMIFAIIMLNIRQFQNQNISRHIYFIIKHQLHKTAT